MLWIAIKKPGKFTQICHYFHTLVLKKTVQKGYFLWSNITVKLCSSIVNNNTVLFKMQENSYWKKYLKKTTKYVIFGFQTLLHNFTCGSHNNRSWLTLDLDSKNKPAITCLNRVVPSWFFIHIVVYCRSYGHTITYRYLVFNFDFRYLLNITRLKDFQSHAPANRISL